MRADRSSPSEDERLVDINKVGGLQRSEQNLNVSTGTLPEDRNSTNSPSLRGNIHIKMKR